MPTAEALDCVAFMLVDGKRVLAEKRKLIKRLAPGAVALPGGHVEAGEPIADALHRELAEELDVDPLAVAEYLRVHVPSTRAVR